MGNTFIILILKIAVLYLVVHASIDLLSRYKAGDTTENTNHRRGWGLVGILTILVVALAWFS